MGLVWKPEMKGYWSTDLLTATPFFGNYMSRDRYLAIMTFFHVVDNTTRNVDVPDKLFKVRPLFDKLAARFKSAYNPRQELSVDESMVPWRGRLSFRMFIPSKPTRYGIKMYCCCEAETGYVCRMQIYTGAGTNGPEKNHGENVVKRLVADMLGLGHTIYMDSFFSSVALYEYLHSHDTMAVGTVLAGRVGVPRCLHPKTLKLKKGEFVFRRKGNLLCLRMNDRKNVVLLSTIHTAEVAVADEDGAEDGARVPNNKPKVITDYNHHMNGVDTFDQNLGYYSFYRKTIKWWKRMAFHLVHLAKVQSYTLYRQTVRSPLSQYVYTKELIRQMVQDVPLKKKTKVRHPPDIERLTARHFQGKEHPSRNCAVCSFRNPDKNGPRYLRKKDTNFMCKQCNLGMCFEPCFELFHTRKDYKRAVIEALQLDL
ncbi:piggyBac transposable element-derived protein 4-like [Littorina saxatilis]